MCFDKHKFQQDEQQNMKKGTKGRERKDNYRASGDICLAVVKSCKTICDVVRYLTLTTSPFCIRFDTEGQHLQPPSFHMGFRQNGVRVRKGKSTTISSLLFISRAFGQNSLALFHGSTLHSSHLISSLFLFSPDTSFFLYFLSSIFPP